VHVIATAGHVDHGKSTLVKALTGSDPDRLAEEHRRGLSIELGYCWTTLGATGDVAFVDVPGHERFLPTMLAGVGPVPAVLFVVAADDLWMPQAAEHLAALDALGVRHGVVAVTRSDLADPAPARERAAAAMGTTTLARSPIVSVSVRTGQGLDELRSRLAAMVGSLPSPDPSADVRLWVDRRFTVKGAGTVVTGTLSQGSICAGDALQFGSATLRVRGVQSLEQPVTCASAVARVALNVTGDDLTGLGRGSVLVTVGAWHFTEWVDVRLTSTEPTTRPRDLSRDSLLHIGAAAVSAHCRALAGDVVRLRLDRRLPLRIRDRAVLRDPGSRTLRGVTVLDPAPPPLTRRGAAAARGRALSPWPQSPDLETEVEHRGLVHESLLRRIGVPVSHPSPIATPNADGWLLSRVRAREARHAIERIVDEHVRRSPLEPGVPLVTVAERLGLPSAALVRALVDKPLRIIEGRVVRPGETGGSVLSPALERALATLREDLADEPFAAPSADRLRELGLDPRGIAAAAKAGRLLRVADGIVLLPGADDLAAAWLSELSQPFTSSEARVRLETSRRVALPLLEHLDRLGLTRRLPDDRRMLIHNRHPPPDARKAEVTNPRC
jgi:selenocysteine-specific elongation factor